MLLSHQKERQHTKKIFLKQSHTLVLVRVVNIILKKIKATRYNEWLFSYHRITLESLTNHDNHPNGGVRGGTIRLLPVDSKAEAKRSGLLSS